MARKLSSFAGEDDGPNPAILLACLSLDQLPLLQPVDQSGHIGSMHDQFPAQFDLSETGPFPVQKVQDIELARAEVPLRKKKSRLAFQIVSAVCNS